MTSPTASGQRDLRMFERRRHAQLVGGVLLAVAVVLTIIVAIDPSSPAVQSLDDRWMRWMVRARSPGWVHAAKLVSAVGATRVTLPVRLLVVAALAWRRRWLQLTAFVAAVLTSELCIGPLKALVDRPRPPASLITTSGAAFPSGHAVAGAVTAFGVIVVLVRAAPRRFWAIGLAAAFTGLMASSRTYLAAHWLTDTIAGACIGTGLALVWPASLELARARWRPAVSTATVAEPAGPESAAAEARVADG